MAPLITIPFSSGLVNAFVFLVIDIFCLWAIHRGLIAIQGYMIYRDVRNGERVVLKRSKMPAISGDLLDYPMFHRNLFVYIHVFVLVLAFVGAYGINGNTQPSTKLAVREYETEFSEKSGILQKEFTRCKTMHENGFTYWKAGFNTLNNARLKDELLFTDESGNYVRANVSTILCQTSKSPLLTVRGCTSDCASVRSSGRRMALSLFSFNESSTKGLAYYDGTEFSRKFSRMYFLRTIKQVNGGAPNTSDTIYCVERPMYHENETFEWAIQVDKVDSFNCAYVKFSKTKKTVQVMYGYLTIPVENLNNVSVLKHEFYIQTAEGTIDWPWSEKLDMFYRPMFSVSFSPSLVDAMDVLIAFSVRAKNAGKIEEPFEQDVTDIVPYAYISLSVLVVLALMLGFVPEALNSFLRPEKEYDRDLLCVNQYDTLSKFCRSRSERTSDCKFAVAFSEDDGYWIECRQDFSDTRPPWIT